MKSFLNFSLVSVMNVWRDFVTHLDVVGKVKYGSQLQMLEPHPDANFWDHEFLSPTFAETIQYRITKHLKDYGGSK